MVHAGNLSPVAATVEVKAVHLTCEEKSFFFSLKKGKIIKNESALELYKFFLKK